MNTIEQLTKKLKVFPWRKLDGTMNTTGMQKYIIMTSRSYDSIFVDGSRYEKTKGWGLIRAVARTMARGLVINSVLSGTETEKCLLELSHDNIEIILYNGYSEDYFIWITPLFVTNLKNVWVKIEQFRIYDVKKMFLDLLEGLKYMKSKNVATGVIHQDNLAYNGKSWYISGIVNSDKMGESQSGCNIMSSIKSRRFICNDSECPLPEDDLWQLVLMYVMTYYGFNPFKKTGTKFFDKNPNMFMVYPNVAEGNCQNITLSTKPDCFGIILQKKFLTSMDLNDKSYELFRHVIENNGTTYTEEMSNHLGEILENQENNTLSVNIHQYTENYKECKCVICFSNTVEYRFLPCNHKACCQSCFTNTEPRNCPMCTEIVTSTEELGAGYITILKEKRENQYFKIKAF